MTRTSQFTRGRWPRSNPTFFVHSSGKRNAMQNDRPRGLSFIIESRKFSRKRKHHRLIFPGHAFSFLPYTFPTIPYITITQLHLFTESNHSQVICANTVLSNLRRSLCRPISRREALVTGQERLRKSDRHPMLVV